MAFNILTFEREESSSGWDKLYVGFDPSLLRFAAALVGRRGDDVIPIACFWSPVEGKTRGEKIYWLTFLASDTHEYVRRYHLLNRLACPVVWGIESNFMKQDSDSFRTIVMADAAIRQVIDREYRPLLDVNNSKWKSYLMGKPSSEGKKSWEKEDIRRILGDRYGVDIPMLDLGKFSRGPKKGQPKLEHNDAWDALGVAAYMAELNK